MVMIAPPVGRAVLTSSSPFVFHVHSVMDLSETVDPADLIDETSVKP
jgi:hypothetical protein